MKLCHYCGITAAILKRPKNNILCCRACFLEHFENEVHATICAYNLLPRDEWIAIGASGGKDSTVLIHVLHRLNQRYGYGAKLVLLSIDEGITGYRDDSLQSVQRNHEFYRLPLYILSYKDLYGWTMDDIVATIGQTNNCTFCGIFRRQALERGARLIGAHRIVTGHNADDMAETVLMNLLRGDISRIDRSSSITTGGKHAANATVVESLPRSKPFKYMYEKEIVMYAYYQKLDYFSTECKYSPFAYRGFAREFIKDAERVDSRVIIELVRSGDQLRVAETEREKKSTIATCEQCGFVSSSSSRICKACTLLEGLNKGKAKLALHDSSDSKSGTTDNNTTSSEAVQKDGADVYTLRRNGEQKVRMLVFETKEKEAGEETSVGTIISTSASASNSSSAGIFVSISERRDATDW